MGDRTRRPARAAKELVAITKAYDLVHERFQRGLCELACAFHRGAIGLAEVKASLASWVGHLKPGDTWGLRRRLMGQVVFVPADGP